MIQASRETIRQLHPDASEEELALIFLELYYGKELAKRDKSGFREAEGRMNAPEIMAAITSFCGCGAGRPWINRQKVWSDAYFTFLCITQL